MILFEEMGLDSSILKAVKDLGFENPTPIQEKVIPRILADKKDLIARAQTGTGKTAAFGLPLIQMADGKSSDIQSLILCPTRELCIQISSDLKKYSAYHKGFRVIPVYGGANIETQIKSLKKGGQIVVGTPGRVLDLIKRKILKIHKIDWLVLDEADEMLNMGFKDDLDDILSGTPKSKQTLLFSATIPKEILRISNDYMTSPDEIMIGNKNVGADNVKHEYYVSHAKYRYEVLKRIADMNTDIYGIVFCRTRRETKEVADKFMNDGYNADALHGDLSQSQRDYVMGRFRNRTIQMLVATDVAARGLDVNDLTHVINYNLPDDLEVYIHRSGRTGRAGKSGISISILHTRETNKIKSLQKLAGKSFEKKMIPGGKEICKKQLFNLVDRVEKVELNSAQIDEFLPEINSKLSWLSREDLIKHFVSVEFNRFLSYYKNAPDLNVESYSSYDRNDRSDGRGGRSDRRDGRSDGRDGRGEGNRDGYQGKDKDIRKSSQGFTRFFINLGKVNDLNAARLMGLINDQTRTRDIEVGKIEIMRKFSFFEIEKDYEAEVLSAFEKPTEFEGARVSVELSKPEPDRPPLEKKHKKSSGSYSKDKSSYKKDKGNYKKGKNSYSKDKGARKKGKKKSHRGQ
ncbi:MAG TPA: DEAD/DEAH box helicase [Bacteroides sp.]|nr:DEAD/DEAH box helicase [Bacteroides sp.]